MGSSYPNGQSSGFLSLRGISKSYGGQAAVESLSLDIAEGEFVSLLGPSGCGKTTTLHMIAGFVEPDAGDILIDGVSVNDLPSHQRRAAMVFQSYALFPHMTVFDNVAFGLRMQKVPRAKISSRVGDALALVRLSALAKRYPGELSGGQQQRVALARAVVLEPRLLLLDEPLSNLDARLRQSLRQDFVEIHKVTGMTTVLVTHDLEEAFATSDRVAVLSEGRLQQFDTPQGIYTRPQTAFVAEFVGHKNTLEGSRRQDGGQVVLQAAGEDIKVPEAAPVSSTKFAIPSHALRLGVAPLALDNCFRAQLTGLTYLGATAQFDVDLNGTKLGGEQAAGKWIEGLRDGDQVYIAWDSADMIALPGKAA